MAVLHAVQFDSVGSLTAVPDSAPDRHRPMTQPDIVTLERLERVRDALNRGELRWDDLTALCRKIDVEKKLRREYSATWKSLASAPLLSCNEWERFFRVWAEIVAGWPAGDPHFRARRLKLINTGLKAADLWQAACGRAEEQVAERRQALVGRIDEMLGE